MYKPNNKKMLTVMISIAMVFSALAILSFAATPAYAASGSITLDPTVFTDHTGSTTIVLANGGSFGSGATVKFYESATTSFSGASQIGTYTLPAGTTTLSNAVVTFSTLASTTAYIAASDDSGSTFTSAVAVTVTSTNPTISVSSASRTPGQTETVTGSGFDSGSSVTLYLNYASGTTLISSVTASALSNGVTFTVPNNLPGSLTGVSYNIVAQESSSSSTYYGITADSSFKVTPEVVVSPISISGALSSSFTVTGHGFPASDSFAASTSLNPADTIAFDGVDALVSSFSSDSTGSFTVTASGISGASPLNTYGPFGVYVTDSSAVNFTKVGSIIVSVPNPVTLGFKYYVSPTTGSTFNVNDSATITVWDFPASQSVTFWLGPYAAGSLTTDANGAGTITTVVPAVAGGTYTPVAVNAAASLTTSPTSGTTSYTITAFFQAVDPSATALTTSTAEYLPSSGLITIQAYGLDPTTTSYDFYDSQVATSSSGSGIGATGGLVTSVAVGSQSSSTGEFQPASNGTLIFAYSPGYSSLSSPPNTGTSVTITSANSVAGYDTNTYAYDAIGTATISAPSSYQVLQAGASQSLSFNYLIPYNANLYPGVTNEYNAYVGTSELTLKFTGSSGVTTGTVFDTSDSSFSFTVPSTNGLFNFNLTYNGQTVATESVGSQPVVISATGSSPSDGSLVVASTSTGYEIVGYGYYSSPSLYYNEFGNLKQGLSFTNYNYGGFSVALSTPTEPAGTYAIYSEVSSSNVNYFVYSTYAVTATLTLGSTSGNIGQSVSVSATGLITTPGYYGLYFGNSFIEYSSSGGTFASFTVPTVPAGSYSVAVKQVGSTSVVADKTFTVKANSAITLGTSSQYAFPGQLVTFSVTGFSLASPLNIPLPGPTEYFAQISFNGTLVATVPASFSSGTLSGSFINPNNAPGSYYKITFGGYLQASALTSSGGSITTGTIAQVALTNSGSTSDFFGLVSGNGALLTGITSSEIATIEADINSTVSTSLTVPISQLNAAITSINGAVATLKTTVGNITADLSTINATVASISSGQALVLTDLGSISTSLASLNASLVAFNNNVVTINTTLGQVVTSLGSIQTQVTTNANGIATIKTDLGTIQGQIVSQNGNVSTIKTSLGTLTTNVSNVSKATTGIPTLEIFLIVIIVLVLITLVISFLAVNAANKAARRATEEKKQ